MDSKTLHFRYAVAKVLLLVALLGLSSVAYAQKTVAGVVTGEQGQTLPGVTVVIKGTTTGTITDLDGKYQFTIPAAQAGSNVSFSYIGYETMEFQVPESGVLNVQMIASVAEIDEVVAIGYGTKRRGDLTGSITSVSEKDFNGGVVSSAEQLISGKVAGVQIMSNSGSPSSGSTIKVRGGASLNASNNPLIVVDGVPLENGGISGNDNNFLSLINPADIESMTVLKDASSTAIYGSRASNGVIIISTKKGSSTGLKISLNSTNSVSFKTRTADMLSCSEFRDMIGTYRASDYGSWLGQEETEWQEEIFQPAFASDNNLSVSGNIAKVLPARASFGILAQDGILKSDNVKRYTAAINLSPSFFRDALKLNASLKASLNDNTFAKTDAIYNAASYDPTQPVFSGNDALLGGYQEYVTDGKPSANAKANPVGLLDYCRNTSTVKRIIANIDADYTLPFLPDMRAHVTGGFDGAEGKGNVCNPADRFLDFTTSGRDFEYGPQTNTNSLFTGYLFYGKKFESISFDATAGYDYQYWHSERPEYSEYNYLGESQKDVARSEYAHALMSYYGRLNATFMGKYMLTATVRRDGTSRFSKDNRWGTFPSVAMAWRVSEEPFFGGLRDWANNVKLRASYGVTGQQDGIGNYNYKTAYNTSLNGASYKFGDKFYNMRRPSAFISELTWETTKAWNFGIDLGFMNDMVTASVDYYTRTTEDLLASVPMAAGTSFAATMLTNVGNVDSDGLEIVLGCSPVRSKDWGLDITFNATWQKYEVSKLSLSSSDEEVAPTFVGQSIDNHQFQVFAEGYTPYTFFLYHQVYDQSDNPIEGAYVDMNSDGEISSSDLYLGQSAMPDWIMGFSLNLRYKKFTLQSSLKANIGNYVFDGSAMNCGSLDRLSFVSGEVNNLNASFLDTRFATRQFFSDFYLHNASFLKMDNISLSYNFGNIAGKLGLNATFAVQNVFTVTKYKGVDPEINNGIDYNFYPRARTFSLSLGFTF